METTFDSSLSVQVRCTTLTRLARLPQAGDGVEGLRYLGLKRTYRLGLQGAVLALGVRSIATALVGRQRTARTQDT